jgi:hypothetical protein
METTYNYKVFYGSAAPNPAGGVWPGAGVWTGITSYNFGTGTKIIMVWIHDNRAVIRFSFDGTTYGDDILLYDSPQAEPFYYAAQSFQIVSMITGSAAVWQVMGQW